MAERITTEELQGLRLHKGLPRPPHGGIGWEDGEELSETQAMLVRVVNELLDARTALALRCPGLATELIKAQKRIVELVDLLIEWQSFANGTTQERAKMAAKVSQYLFHQTAGETAERRTPCT